MPSPCYEPVAHSWSVRVQLLSHTGAGGLPAPVQSSRPPGATARWPLSACSPSTPRNMLHPMGRETHRVDLMFTTGSIKPVPHRMSEWEHSHYHITSHSKLFVSLTFAPLTLNCWPWISNQSLASHTGANDLELLSLTSDAALTNLTSDYVTTFTYWCQVLILSKLKLVTMVTLTYLQI